MEPEITTIEELAERLKAARKALGLTQSDLASRWRCNLNTISRIEQGTEPGMLGLYSDAVVRLELLAKKKS